MSRRKQRQKRRGGTRLLRIRLDKIELAAARDELLRGGPEPVFMVGMYRVVGDEVTLLDRHLERVDSVPPRPVTVPLAESLEVRVPRKRGMRLVVLALALEEDGGGLVTRLFASLAAPDRLALWSIDEAEPDPMSVADWARRAAPAAPASATVHLLEQGADLRDSRLGDDWVGASVFHLSDEKASAAPRRLRFASADETNDWTLVMRVRVV